MFYYSALGGAVCPGLTVQVLCHPFKGGSTGHHSYIGLFERNPALYCHHWQIDTCNTITDVIATNANFRYNISSTKQGKLLHCQEKCCQWSSKGQALSIYAGCNCALYHQTHLLLEVNSARCWLLHLLFIFYSMQITEWKVMKSLLHPCLYPTVPAIHSFKPLPVRCHHDPKSV